MEYYQQGLINCFCDKIKKKCSLCKLQSAFEKEKRKEEWFGKIIRISVRYGNVDKNCQ